jgi:steroid 5-alpha reductase family enzyme
VELGTWNLELLLLAFLLMAVIMAAVWLVQRRMGDAGVVDVAWTYGIGLVVLLFAAFGGGHLPRRVLVAAMAGLWSLRLGTYLLVTRILGHKPEDGRYQALRAKWGPKTQRNLFRFYQYQGVSVVLFALSPWAAMAVRRPSLGLLDFLGIAVWLASVAGETAADRQLARFRADPANRGTTCRVGWWRYSRHPNYFFEWLHWCSYVVMAVGQPLVWVPVVVMLLMFYVLTQLTGIPTTEAHALESRRDYADYQRTTPRFIPWFPRGGAAR